MTIELSDNLEFCRHATGIDNDSKAAEFIGALWRKLSENHHVTLPKTARRGFHNWNGAKFPNKLGIIGTFDESSAQWANVESAYFDLLSEFWN